MSRYLLTALALGAAAALGACTDGRSPLPTAPRAPDTPSLALGPALAACDPSGIRQTMATLYPTNVFKQVALPTFNLAEQYRQAGQYALARAAYYRLIDDLVLRYKNNILQTPSLFESTQQGVHYVVRVTLACAGDPEPDELALVLQKVAGALVIPPSSMSDPRYQVCPILHVDQESSCVVPNGQAAVLLPPGFLQYEALVLMQPDLRGIDPYILPYGSIWSGRWRIRIAPLEAQASYGLPETVVTPLAAVAFCAADFTFDSEEFHAPPGLLRVAEVAEATSQTALLPRTANAALFALLAPNCRTATNQPLAALAPAHGSYPARRGWQLAHRAATALAGWFAPRPLYAFDGGAGGTLRSFRSFFAAVEEPTLYIRDDDPVYGMKDPLPLLTGATKLVHASRTRYGEILYPSPDPVPSPRCTWTSSHTRVRVSPTAGDGGLTATLTIGNSAGEATLTAACHDRDEFGGAVVRQASVLVVVSRP